VPAAGVGVRAAAPGPVGAASTATTAGAVLAVGVAAGVAADAAAGGTGAVAWAGGVAGVLAQPATTAAMAVRKKGRGRGRENGVDLAVDNEVLGFKEVSKLRVYCATLRDQRCVARGVETGIIRRFSDGPQVRCDEAQ